MDFSFSEEQEAVRDLAARVFSDRAGDERLRELEASGVWFDEALWAELVRTNLAGLCVPAAYGGGGYGLLELCLVLEEAGRHLAQVPLLPSLALGALPLAAFGSEEQKRRWLPALASGDALLSAALHEPGVEGLSTRARRDGPGWRLTGEKVCVPAAERAAAFLVPARTADSGTAVFLVEPGAALVFEPQQTTRREPRARLILEGAAGQPLGDPARGADADAFLREHALVAHAALQLGVAEEALRRTASYTSERRQFGRPIATFQGVALRAADAFIDIEAMRATLWQAAWRLAAGLPAAREVAAAAWWACRAGDRVVHTAQHLHGGIGADLEYPIHRFFFWAVQTSAELGGGSALLASLGARLVAEERR